MPDTVRPGRRRPSGFTLIELMVTVAVVAIIAVVAVPNLVSVIDANRLRSQTDELVASLQLARSEAIRRNARVTVCASADGATCGGDAWNRWVVRAPDIDGTVDVVQSRAIDAPVQVTGSDSSISFGPTGLASAPLTLTTCIPTQSIAENQRLVTVMVGGSVGTVPAEGGGDCPGA